MVTAQERFFLTFSIIVAFVAIFTGYMLPSPGTNILKDIMVFAGGFGIAFVLASAGGRATSNRDAEASKEKVRSLCNRSVQRLVLTASQTLEGAALIRKSLADEGEAEWICALFENAADQARVSIGDLEEMAGVKIGLDERVSVLLNSILEATNALPESKAKEELQDKITAIKKPLEEVREGTTTLGLATVAVPCPACGGVISVTMGDQPGATRHCACPTCFSRVVVNRVAAGQIVAKQFKPPYRSGFDRQTASLPASPAQLTCPGCRRPIPIMLKGSEGNVVVRSCFTCHERLYIDVASGKLLRHEKVEPTRTDYWIRSDKALIQCPSCMNTIRTRLPTGGTPITISCPRCTTLLEAILAQGGESKVTFPAGEERAAGGPQHSWEAAVLTRHVLDRSESEQASHPRLTFQKANEGNMALADGRIQDAGKSYKEAGELGLLPAFDAINRCMVAVLNGSASDARAALMGVADGKAGPFMRVQLEALRSLCSAQEGNLDVSHLRGALNACPFFRMSQSPLQHLRAGMVKIGKVGEKEAFSLLEAQEGLSEPDSFVH